MALREFYILNCKLKTFEMKQDWKGPITMDHL